MEYSVAYSLTQQSILLVQSIFNAYKAFYKINPEMHIGLKTNADLTEIGVSRQFHLFYQRVYTLDVIWRNFVEIFKI